MAFEVSQFSTKGLELLGQLSSHKSLVIKNILAAETAYTAADFEQNIAWWTQETNATMAKVNASLSSAGHDKDQARLTIKFTAKPGHQDNIGIKTVIVIACGKESGVETDDIVYCGVSDPQGITVLGYKEGGVDVSTAVSLYFKFNAASNITLATNENPDFVLHSEMDRFVSCHKVGDVTVGEDQEIRGSKYFINGIMLNGQDSRPCIEFTDAYGRQDIACTVGVMPQDRGIGISYGAHLFTDTDHILAMDLDNGTPLYDLTKKRASYHVPELYIDGLVTNSINVDTDDDITLKANITPLNNDISIGTTATPFNNIFATKINCKEIACTRGATFDGVTAINLNGAFVNADVQVKVTQMEGVVEKAGNTLNIKGLQTTARGNGGLLRYATMFTDVDTGFRFCCGPDASSSYNDTSLRMSINNTAIKTEVPLYIDKGAELAQNQVLKLNGKVECTTFWTDQVMLAVPKIASTVVDAENKVYTANIPVGGIVLLYDQIGKFGRGSLGIEAGKRFPVGENDMRIAMAIGSAAETSIPNYTWLGNSNNFQTATGKNKIYAPTGDYVALMGATATSPDHWVAILALRYS